MLEAIDSRRTDLGCPPAAVDAQRTEQLLETPRACLIQPSDAQLALCSLYANRWYTMKRLVRVSARLGIKPDMRVWDQFLIRRTGQRMVTFVTDVKKLEDGRKVAPSFLNFNLFDFLSNLSAVALGADNLHVTCNVPQHQLHHGFSSQLCQHT